MEEEGCLIGGQKRQGRMNLVNLDTIISLPLCYSITTHQDCQNSLLPLLPHPRSTQANKRSAPFQFWYGNRIYITTKGGARHARARAQRLRSYGSRLAAFFEGRNMDVVSETSHLSLMRACMQQW